MGKGEIRISHGVERKVLGALYPDCIAQVAACKKLNKRSIHFLAMFLLVAS